MLWFSMQSLPMLLLAFVVGLLVGWLAWGRQWQPVQDESDLDEVRASRHRAEDRQGDPAGAAASMSVTASAVAEAVTEPSRLDALLASLTEPDEARSLPTVRVSQRAASEPVVVVAAAEPEPADPPGLGYAAGSTLHNASTHHNTSTHHGALEAASRIAAASQRVADRAAAAAPTDHGSSSFRTSFEPTTDPFGLALGAPAGGDRPTTGEVTLAAFGDHLSQSSVKARSASVFHEDDDLVTVLNQSTHAPADLGPESAMIDDLTRIEGVNPAMAAALSAEGLRTYEDVAQATEDRLRRALRIARIRSAPGIGFWAPRASQLAQQRTDHRPVEDAAAVEPAVEEPAVVAAQFDEAELAATELDEAELAETELEEPELEETELGEDSFDSLLGEPLTAAQYAEVADDPEAALAEPVAEPDVELVVEPVVEPLAEADVEPLVEPAVEPEADVVPLPTTRDDAPSTPRHAEPAGTERAGWLTEGDDLEQIGGVGRRISEVLQAAGITSFVQLAAARDHELKTILTDAGVRQPASLVTWSVQAALLLQGDVEGAATLADGLMTGRETG